MHTLTDISHEVFKLKAGLFTLTTCHLFDTNLSHLEEKLLLMTEQTPHFFQQLPIILDLSSLDNSPEEIIDFPSITACLRRYKLIPIGIRGGSPKQQNSAIRTGLAVLANIKSDYTETTSSKSSLSPPTGAKVIKRPVRSGQQIYAKNSDLIVLSTVSPGAELLADGNIHIYGRLRGRALAGVNGDPNTHIFCRSLEAELVAIAGHYWLSEDLHGICPPHDTEGVHIFLHEERLKITTLA